MCMRILTQVEPDFPPPPNCRVSTLTGMAARVTACDCQLAMHQISVEMTTALANVWRPECRLCTGWGDPRLK